MLKRLSVLVLFALLSVLCRAQVVIKIQSVPANTSSFDKLYLAGNLNNWNPGDEKFMFKRSSDGTYSLTLNLIPGKYEFKVTRGSWEKTEVDSIGNPIRNRFAELQGNETIVLDVDGWSDTYMKQLVHTASKNVYLIDSVFYIPQLETHRRVWIYLPTSYFDKSTKKKKYPVLYMHDGQNLFDDYYAPYGEWDIDEILDSLKKE